MITAEDTAIRYLIALAEHDPATAWSWLTDASRTRYTDAAPPGADPAEHHLTDRRNGWPSMMRSANLGMLGALAPTAVAPDIVDVRVVATETIEEVAGDTLGAQLVQLRCTLTSDGWRID